jgi:hypothetical protein
MQVFLPYPDLEKSVQCLDPKRLGNQVYRECLTLIRGGWPNHPVAKMWHDCQMALASYALYGLDELERRGRDYPHHVQTFTGFLDTRITEGMMQMPVGFGDDQLHSSHRAALLYKDFAWYSQFGWTEFPAIPNLNGKLPYYWPPLT